MFPTELMLQVILADRRREQERAARARSVVDHDRAAKTSRDAATTGRATPASSVMPARRVRSGGSTAR